MVNEQIPVQYSVAIVGCGIIAEHHARAAKDIPGVTVRAVADIAYDRAQSLANELQARCYKDYMQMLREERLDIVIIATPPFLHKDIALEAASRGIHIMCEKPMALHMEECDEMIHSAERNGVKLMVLHPAQYYNEYVQAKRLLQSGVFGNLLMLQDRYYFNYFKPDRPTWCFTKELAGGGVFSNIGIHTLDKIHFLTDHAIRSQTGKAGFYKSDDRIEGFGQMFMELENGVTAVLTLSGYDNDFVCEMECICTNGKLAIGSFPPKLAVYEEKGWRCVDVRQEKSHQRFMLKDFIACIQQNRSPRSDGRYGKMLLRAVDSLHV